MKKQYTIILKLAYLKIESSQILHWKKIRRRLPNKQLKKRKEPTNYNGRTYTDYLEYKVQNPNITPTEMDTLYRNQTGPYIQTFIFENTEFMIGILHTKKRQIQCQKA